MENQKERKLIIKKIILLIAFYGLIGAGIFYSTRKIHFEENISTIIPANKDNAFLRELLDSASFFDRILFHVYLTDSASSNPGELVSTANELTDSITQKFIPDYITKIEGKADVLMQYRLLQSFYRYLPLYLEDKDYQRLDSLIRYGDFNKMLQEYLKALNSPAGIMVSKFMFRDPFGLAARQLTRLKSLQIDDSLVFYQNYLFTSDKHNLLFFLTPKDVGNTARDAEFVKQIDKIIDDLKQKHNNKVRIEYLGSLPAAAANSTQIKKDIKLTVSIASVIIILLIYYFFRRKSNLVLILIPASFGITVALIIFAVFRIKVSAIALGMGSVLLAISVDYALHLLTHLKHTNNIGEVVRKVAGPILVGSLTTALAFLLMMLLSSPALKQLGLFAAISIFASALAAIFILPFFTNFNEKEFKVQKFTLIEKLAGIETGHNIIKIIILVVLTAFFFYYAQFAGIEKDIEKSNFMPEYLKKAEQNLNKVSELNRKKIYLLSSGTTLDKAIVNSESNNSTLEKLKKAGKIDAFFSIQSLIFSQDQQQSRINNWKNFWTNERITALKTKLTKAAVNNHFKPNAFDGFYQTLSGDLTPVPPDTLFASFAELTGNFCIHLHDRILIASVIRIENLRQKENVAYAFKHENSAYMLDKKDFYQKMFDTVQVDFNTLLNLSMIMVFLIILIFLGRIETTIITFLPIFLSWFWILGMMGFADIKLNYFNIIICSLIFGLGDDYSIYTTDGLLQKYKFGNDDLISNKSSIFISILSIVTGLGVLIFAKHPALRSIAVLSVIGLVTAVIISLTLQPVLFRILTEYKGKKRPRPIEAYNLLLSLIIFSSFGILSIVLTILLPLFYLFPAKKSGKRYLMRAIVCKGCKWIMDIYHPAGRDKIGFDKNTFENPSLIVSNHQSMVDILIYMSLSPKILLLTKDWVWNSPLFGLVARFSGHINVSHGYDTILDTIKDRINEGCSLVVFPEGSRTDTGQIKRFHKGGFYLAQKLDLPIQVFLLHGLWDVLPRGTFVLSPGRVTTKRLYSFCMDKNDPRAYYNASKETCLKMRQAYKDLTKELETPYYLRNKLISNYTYKGPIVEIYMKIKLRLEKYYDVFDRLIPEKAVITDIGCGYGPMTFILGLRSAEREIYAIDYDEEKIDLARNCELVNHCNIKFEAADAIEYDLHPSDVFLISDMLHYLSKENQELLLKRCIEKLKDGGQIIIRDGDSQLTKRHNRTVFSEFLSTKIGFNKTMSKLTFFSKSFIETIAVNNGLLFSVIEDDRLTRMTSNQIYVFKRLKNESKI
jgi:uncharacterized protein